MSVLTQDVKPEDNHKARKDYFFFLKVNEPQLRHIKWKMINATYFKNQQGIYNPQEEEFSLLL